MSVGIGGECIDGAFNAEASGRHEWTGICCGVGIT